MPVIGAVIATFVGNAFLDAMNGMPNRASAWLACSLIPIVVFIIVYFLSMLPSRRKWTLPEAVAYLGFGRPIRKHDWVLFNAARFHKGITTITQHIGTNTEDHYTESHTSETVLEEKQQFKECLSFGARLLTEAARRGELKISGRRVETNQVEEIHANYFVDEPAINFLTNEILFEHVKIGSDPLRFDHVILIRDEVLAIKNFWRPLFPPTEMSRGELMAESEKRREIRRGVSITLAGFADGSSPEPDAAEMTMHNTQEEDLNNGQEQNPE